MGTFRTTCSGCGTVYLWEASPKGPKARKLAGACHYCGSRGIETATPSPPDLKKAVKHILSGYGRVSPEIEKMPDVQNGLAWLRALRHTIWEQRIDKCRHQKWSTERRRLTADEWVQVQHIIREHGLICSMHNACMGFGCGMAIYEEAPMVYPGMANEPDFLIDITRDHLPLATGQDRTTFDEGWAAFHPFTHTDKNADRLREHGLSEPREKSHYTY